MNDLIKLHGRINDLSARIKDLNFGVCKSWERDRLQLEQHQLILVTLFGILEALVDKQ